jgi:glycosyltransferase involved in cell wall biosynthesis
MSTILHTEWSKGWGGQEIRIIQDSLEFSKRGYRVLIVCQPGTRLSQVAEENGIPVIPLTMRSGMDLLAIWKCRRIIKKNAVNLVHTHSSVDSWCCSIASKFSGVPVIRSRHISAPIRTNCISSFLYMKLADRVITSGESIREKMIKINGYDPLRIISIPTGVDEKWFSREINGEGIRKEFNIGKEDFLLGIVAMLRNWKGHFHLLEGVKNLRDKNPHLKLLIVGDGPDEEITRKAIINDDLSGTVIMTGYRRDIPQILRSLDLFVLPSYANEGVPQAILQAMASGIPVLSTRAGGIDEVVKNGKTGTLVPPQDPPALSAAIEWIYRHREESLKMAANAREFILNHFTVKDLADKSEKVYREVLSSPKGDKAKSLVDHGPLIGFDRPYKFNFLFNPKQFFYHPWGHFFKDKPLFLPKTTSKVTRNLERLSGKM